MKNLTHLKLESPEQWLSEALNCKKENVNSLKEIKDALSVCLESYGPLIENSNANPSPSLLLASKELLISYYESAPSSLKKLIKSRRNDHDLSECPSCGNPTIPDTLDHFVPKDHWPEFSINPNNLVPQCRECAPIKGAKYYCTKDQAAIFLHPIYSETLSQIEFSISIEFEPNTQKIELDVKLLKPESMSDEQTLRIVRHFKNLQTSKRIKFFCYREINKWKSKLKEKKFDIKTALEVRIQEKNDNEKSRNWKTALYQAMLKNKDLIEYLSALSNKKNTPLQEPKVEVDF